MKKKYYLCPVCGFDKLKEPPYGKGSEPSYEICACCGFEFGFDAGNKDADFKEFRQRWIKRGTPWFTPQLKPAGWDFQKQLGKLSKIKS